MMQETRDYSNLSSLSGMSICYPKASKSSVFVIRGEIQLIITSLRRNPRWTSHQQDSKADIILRKFQALKDSLDSNFRSTSIKISADANYFLVPFLDVIRSDEISGPITALALSSVEKFIVYNIINEANGSSGAVEAITDAAIHANFVSTDSASDELVLMKILNVLHRLFLSQLGPLLSNESVCELMQACFRMCFIERANELLRKSAETALIDMVRLLFARLHTFPTLEAMKRSKSQTSLQQPPPIVFENPELESSTELPSDIKESLEATSTEEVVAALEEVNYPIPGRRRSSDNPLLGKTNLVDNKELPEIQVEEATPEKPLQLPPTEFKNSSGVKFTIDGKEKSPGLASEHDCTPEEWTTPTIPSTNKKFNRITVPYGIPCVRELFRFLISLVNPHEKHNTEVMIHLGLKLLLVTVEVGVDAFTKHTPIMLQVKADLCKNLIALLNFQTQGSSSSSGIANSAILLSVLRILFMIFENMRHVLKYQLEIFLIRLTELINESSVVGTPSNAPVVSRWNYEQKEIALDFLIQLWKLPCFVTELYLNYDCNLFTSNLFEDTTKSLSKNAFPMQTNINSIHLLCLDGLLSILDGIEEHCTLRMTTANTSNSSSTTSNGLSDESYTSVFYYDDTTNQNQKQLETVVDENNLQQQQQKPVIQSKNTNSTSTCSSDGILPTHEQLMAIRHKKKIFHSGSEQFNLKASKGIEFLQSQGILRTPLDAVEVASFLRENPLLDKKIIGDYIADRKNSEILRAFIQSFDFVNIRIDEALRIFLESFRLPGEAVPISLILEEFAAHWSASNGNPFANIDAAYILAYQVIMLNVDQHNSNVKKQAMTLDGLKANLKGTNGGQDFDPEMLKDIYNSIKSDEILLPSEHIGQVKENYLWKVLIRRSASPTCIYQSPLTDEGIYDHDLFSLSWGPIVAALSFIFDKTSDSATIIKALNGFRKCATISAHYGMSDVFDNLVISLCKFTSLTSLNPDLSSNIKSQSSCRQVFQLIHRHGDILHDGWKNFVDCLVALFKMQVLPKVLTESEDFIEPSGRISIIRRSLISTPRQETGLFSSLYSYIALSNDSPNSKSSIAGEEENRKKLQTLILECRPELLLSESKFLQIDSLLELIKALVYAAPVPESKKKDYDEDQSVFALEVLIKICIQNRDRALSFWNIVCDHLFAMILAGAAHDMPFILERSSVGLLRLALRLMRKDDLCPVVLQSLKVLLYLRPTSIIKLSHQLSFGLHEILKTTAANIHTSDEWSIVFTSLEYIGAGKVPALLTSAVNAGTIPEGSNSTARNAKRNSDGLSSPSPTHPALQHSVSQDPLPQSGPVGYSSGSDRGYTSDSELEIRNTNENNPSRNGAVSPAQSWILLTQDDQQIGVPVSPVSPRRSDPNSMVSSSSGHSAERQLFYPDPKSLMKSCESLSFLVRDAAHITPDNFTLCVGAIRSFVEASTMKPRPTPTNQAHPGKKNKKKRSSHEHASSKQKAASFSTASAAYDADESDSEDQIAISQQVALQLLELLHTLHTRAAQIFQWWQKEMSISGAGIDDTTLWCLGWKPLLQAIGILCCDARKPVRTTALTFLQRALLVPDLQQLSPLEWFSCFNEVLFPLLAKLLETLNPPEMGGMEETRMRAATLLCKVFLQHLSSLLQLENFATLWIEILNYLDKYMNHADKSELLQEAIPENLKNLLLVMETAGVFHTSEGYTKLWMLTWDKIDSFLPSLRADLIRSVPPVEATLAIVAKDGSAIEESVTPASPQQNVSLIHSNLPLNMPFVIATSESDYPNETCNIQQETVSYTVTSPQAAVINSATTVTQESEIPTSSPSPTSPEGQKEQVDATATPNANANTASEKIEYTSILFGEDDSNEESFLSCAN